MRADWEHHITEEPGIFGGSQEVVYRGDACNCQARVLYDDEKVIGWCRSASKIRNRSFNARVST